ncbi:MAG: pilus assembly protein PilM [bacterium]|nr:pilus assembly protein PilM [bacterium]
MSLFSRKESYIGLDIGTSSIKIVELKREGKDQIRLVTYASAKSAESLASDQNNSAVAHVATIAHEILRRAGVTSSEVVAALPSLSVFSAVLSLPDMSERDLEKAVVLAAKNYVPSPLKDVVLGWTVMKEGISSKPALPVDKSNNQMQSVVGAVGKFVDLKKNENSGQEKQIVPVVPEDSAELKVRRPLAKKNSEIFLTAAPKELVQRYSAVIDRLNLSLVALEVESFPLSRSLLGNAKEPALLVDIGDLATNFSIVDNGYLRINQSVDIGGAVLTKAVVSKFGVSLEVAEARKFSFGLTSEKDNESTAMALKPVVKDIIDRSINLKRIFERKSNKVVGRVVLIGGGANLKGLAQFWQETSGMFTEVGNPWKGVRVPLTLTNKLIANGPSFAVAVGLALRELELGD